jgi:hypothetical protein
MAKYNLSNRNATTPALQACTTTFNTLASMNGVTASLCRGRIYSLNIGADGAPNSTDCQIVWAVRRMSAAGTGTAGVPQPKNAADPATTRSATFINYPNGTPPTITANSAILYLTLNQRASQFWQAPDQDGMLWWAATNLAGLTVDALSPTYTGNLGASVDFEEI